MVNDTYVFGISPQQRSSLCMGIFCTDLLYLHVSLMPHSKFFSDGYNVSCAWPFAYSIYKNSYQYGPRLYISDNNLSDMGYHLFLISYLCVHVCMYAHCLVLFLFVARQMSIITSRRRHRQTYHAWPLCPRAYIWPVSLLLDSLSFRQLKLYWLMYFGVF